MTGKIIFTPVHKALDSLRRSLEQPLDEFTRDSVIQRFEYSYELLWKILKRYLEEDHNIAESNIRSLWKHAFKFGYIDDADIWLAFHQARNLTSHTYNEATAEDVYNHAKLFLPNAETLLSKVEATYHDARQS